MKFLIVLALIGCVAAQKQNKFAGKFVYDLLKNPLSAAEAAVLLTNREVSYPTLNAIPKTSFDCSSKAQPGFYADVETQCQVFHRCEQSGNQTAYLCSNTTVFNQITLVCDLWYNVDCGRSLEVEDFANSRLYTNLPLFDSPPADYVAPSQLAAAVQLSSGAIPIAAAPKAKVPAKVPAKAAPKGRADETPAAPIQTPTNNAPAGGAAENPATGDASAAAATGNGVRVSGRAESASSFADQQTAPAATGSDDTAAAAPAKTADSRRKRFAFAY
ncbi:hypothetical protein BV898_06187 [Hypsibius exemplaris]|uniref:Chitin-binding type-2 domain-containing protein n=1 Tax=Hypsibius exemplaris TaxID=2072580 RepID=A0A1W0WXI7_HYPEX|nr:hypothetical protein BV898_06187 [Hypsibius exemplaris]